MADRDARAGGAVNHADMVRRSGASYRQILHWTGQGYLHAHDGGGSGFPYDWAETEVPVAAAMKRMTDAGVLPAAAARAARNGGQLAPGVRVLIEAEVSA